MIQFEHLLNQLVVDDKVRQWLAEDLDAIDVAGSLVGNALTCANLYCKHIDRVVLAGRPFVNSIFRQLNCSIEWIESRIDGDIIEKPQVSYFLELI
jgi:nicotinate-nucleotide pyrophosphorylase